MNEITEAVKARFWAKVDRRGPDECWPWTGAVSSTGYGSFHLFSVNRKAHRAALWIFVGEPVPGMPVDHTCRNRRCVNPAHLRQASWRENALENSVSVTAINAAKTHCPQGHPYSGDNLTINKSNGGRICRICGRESARKYEYAKYWRQKAYLKEQSHERLP